VVKICTQYAQKGMWNLSSAILMMTLAFALLNPNFFVAYLIPSPASASSRPFTWQTPAVLGQCEKNRGSRLEGEGIGAPRRDSHWRYGRRPFQGYLSVSMNPIIKFSTLFGLLATEITIEMAVHAKESGGTTTPFMAVPIFMSGSLCVAFLL